MTRAPLIVGVVALLVARGAAAAPVAARITTENAVLPGKKSRGIAKRQRTSEFGRSVTLAQEGANFPYLPPADVRGRTTQLTCRAGVSTPVWCGAWFGSNPTCGQYSQSAGTKRKTLPATATRPTDGNGR